MIGVKNHWVILENDDQNVIRKEIIELADLFVQAFSKFFKAKQFT